MNALVGVAGIDPERARRPPTLDEWSWRGAYHDRFRGERTADFDVEVVPFLERMVGAGAWPRWRRGSPQSLLLLVTAASRVPYGDSTVSSAFVGAVVAELERLLLRGLDPNGLFLEDPDELRMFHSPEDGSVLLYAPTDVLVALARAGMHACPRLLAEGHSYHSGAALDRSALRALVAREPSWQARRVAFIADVAAPHFAWGRREAAVAAWVALRFWG